MDIGIIGSGNIGIGLGRLWAKQGHHVMLSYFRRFRKLEDIVLEIGSHARSGTPRDGVSFADVLLLAVRGGSSTCALGRRRDEREDPYQLRDPFGPGRLDVGLNTSAAEEISRLVPGAAVVEAFNTALRVMNSAR